MIEISGANKDFTSIIICAVNHLQDLTIPCIRSVIQNTGENYELILIDDGSQDATYQYFRSISRKAYRHKTPKGVAKSRNLGFRVSEGNYILTLDNDTIVPSGWLKTLIAESKKERVGIIGPWLSAPPRYEKNLQLSADGLYQVYDIPGACMLIKRELVDRIGHLDERYINAAEDTDYCYRAIMAGYRVVITPKVIVYHKSYITRQERPQIQTQVSESRRKLQERWRGIFC